MKRLYEDVWHRDEKENLTHCTVESVQVLHQSVLPGCSRETITCKDSDGRIFRTSPRNYFETEDLAWKTIRITLELCIKDNEKRISDLLKEIESFKNILKEIT